MSQTIKTRRPESEEAQSFFDFDDYDNVIGFLISQAADVLVKQLEAIFQADDVSLTPREFAMLNRLAQFGELTQIELSELTYKDAPSTSRVVESLRRKQLVRRKTSRSDRRSTDISLTDKGREIRDRVAPQIADLLQRATGASSNKELAAAVTVLKRVIAYCRDLEAAPEKET
jgi:DNA-binding MarR family transcriptional regulator